MGKYLRFLNEYISSDDDFVFNHEANLVAAFGLGHVSKSRRAFRWCESYERTGPEKYTSDESEKVYNYLSKNKKSVTVPISFTAYLDELFLNYKTEYNAYKMYFLKQPKQYVYELFYDKEFVPTEPQKKRKLQNTEETNSAKKKKGDTVDDETEQVETVVDDNQTAEDVPVGVESETTVDNTGHRKTTLDKIAEYNIELKNMNNPSRKIIEIIRKVPFVMEIVINDMNDAEKTAFFNAFKSSIHDYVVEETAKLEKEREEKH